MVNAAWFGMILSSQQKADFREVAPELIFAGNQVVRLKTPFDSTFFAAEPNQVLLADTQIHTGEQSFAEIQIEGNVVRLDENTQLTLLENNFQNPQEPRFVFHLDSGSVWVNAFDPILVQTSQGEALFAHTVGVYTYSRPLNRVMSIIGNVDLALLDEKGDPLIRFVVPLKSQVTFTDSQIIPEYARLEYSKLKKELKMGSLSSEVLEVAWVKRNTRDDAILFLAENHYIFSAGTYRFKDSYYKFTEKLSLVPSQKRLAHLNRAKVKLRYLLGGIHEGGLTEKAKTLLKEFDALVQMYEGDPAMMDLIERQFYAIRNVHTDTPAYMVKENLREYLFSKDTPELLRTYLADLNFLMRTGDFKEAEKLAKKWLEKWGLGLRVAHFPEFEQQVRIYHSIMLAHSEEVSLGLLAVLDEAGDSRLEQAENAEETLFEIALERLEISKYLVAAYRYPEAKNYLRTSYSKLNLAEKETSAAAREIFLKDASLLAERIAFVEEILRGAARPIDETEFKDYLSAQERDKGIEERFVSLLEETKPIEEKPIYPTVDDVAKAFGSVRIVVLDEDIIGNPDFPFTFEVKIARLIERTKDGSSLTFSAQYDYSTNAVYDIVLNETPIAGNYALEDFVRIAIAGEVKAQYAHISEVDISDLTDFLSITDTEEARRAQVIAQDLAVQLMIKELEIFNILIASSRQVTVLNPATLSEFSVIGVTVKEPEGARKVIADFDYNSVTKTLSNVTVKDSDVDLSGQQISPNELAVKVFGVIHGKEEKKKVLSESVIEFRDQDLLTNEQNISVDIERNLVTFQDLRVKSMPLELNGVYDRTAKVFITVEHPLFSAENTAVNEYVTSLSTLWVIDYLKSKGITILEGNIKTPLPAERVEIKDYVRGDKILDFVFNVSANRLENIILQTTGSTVDSMTFEEFERIGGGEAAAAYEAQQAAQEAAEAAEAAEEEVVEEDEEEEESGPALPGQGGGEEEE